ncbi:MAG: cytochrome c3 family protein [Chromatiales bacterium]|nr:cytochrome c3 family protein [Chromatiales bacterium]
MKRVIKNIALVAAISAIGGCVADQMSGAPSSTAATPTPVKPINDYNITINYELGMHCTGFDFTYCRVLPPYNSVQSQVIKTATGKKKYPELLEADGKDPTVVVDGKKKFKLSYGHVGNTYAEGNKLKYWDVPYDVNGDGKYTENENVANAYFSHLYVYKDLKGTNPTGTSADSKKLFVGIQVPVPRDNGPAGAAAPSPLKGGHLHYTGEKGTIVYTKSSVLDNVPIVLTNPGIWDALGLPLTPFTDRAAKQDLLTLVESDVQPYQEAWVSLVDAKSGSPVVDSHSGEPIRFVGTNPIDIPNCANCHSNKTANGDKFTLYKQERAFWKGLGASDWIANLKATSVSILEMHDDSNGTDFMKNYNPRGRTTDNRLGRDPVLCQKCHADNVIGVLQSKTFKDKNGKKKTIPALTEAIHTVHQTKVPMPDSHGRTAACQGCHPAHRQDGNMDAYPITPEGKNAYADGDNRDAAGGCYVGRDVHSNPGKDSDGVETTEYLNSIGEWMKTNVSKIGTGEGGKGIWCTNCHSQLSRELYQRDNLTNAFKQEGTTIRNKSLNEIAKAIGVSKQELIEKYLDPKVVLNDKGEDTPGKSGILLTWAKKRLVPDIAIIALKGNGPMVSKDVDGDVSVKILSANPAVDIKSLKLPKGATGATAVPYDAATNGRDYWLAPGVPHCADCHAAPFVEGQGGVAFPINQPGKYSSMRYSKGHAGIACQSCHQSIHGLYPVTPNIDLTTYNQPTQYNPDGSHGPLRCNACHETNTDGVPHIANDEEHVWKGKPILHNYDAAVNWIHSSAPDLGGAIPEEE